MIEGLSHITFVVSDLDRMERLLVTIFEAKKIYDSGGETFSIARERFFEIAGLWIAVMEGEPGPRRGYDHIAFKIDEADIDLYLRRISELGLELREPRSRVEGEGRSIYFYDHDDHLFELHTGTLQQRLERYARAK